MNKSHTWPCFSFNEGRHCELASVEMNEKNTNVHNSMVSCNSGGLSFTLQFPCPGETRESQTSPEPAYDPIAPDSIVQLRLLRLQVHHDSCQCIFPPVDISSRYRMANRVFSANTRIGVSAWTFDSEIFDMSVDNLPIMRSNIP